MDLQSIILNDSVYVGLMNQKGNIYNTISYYGVIIMGRETKMSLHHDCQMLLDKIDEHIVYRVHQLTKSFEEENKYRKLLDNEVNF